MNSTKPILAITMGNPAGIVPEIAIKPFGNPELPNFFRPILVGNVAIMEQALQFSENALLVKKIESLNSATFEPGVMEVLDIDLEPEQPIEFGEISADAGNLAFHSVIKAIELAISGEVDGTVTNPIHKKAINEAGHHFSGHTEIYAEYTNTPKYAMLLADDDIKVIHVSTHVSLRKACDLVKKARVLEVIEIMDAGLKRLGISNPRIGVAGLNPHAGDEGLFGDEEINEISPAIEEARSKGIRKKEK